MNTIELIVAVLATISPFTFGILLYYRALLKSKLEKINQPPSKQEFTLFSPAKLLNYFTEEPRINQSTKQTPLFNRYDAIETVMKYAFHSTLIFNFIRALIVYYWKI